MTENEKAWKELIDKLGIPGANKTKASVAELMESETSKLLKKEILHMDELNDYLRMLADMDKIGIRRKLVLLEGYINKVKRTINE